MFKLSIGRISLVTLMALAAIQTAPSLAMDTADGSVQEGGSWLSKKLIVGAVAGGFGALWYSHYNQLHAIEQHLDKSSTKSTAKGENFLFATWRCGDDNAPDGSKWESPHELWLAHEGVQQKLYNDAQQAPDRAFVYDAFGTRIEPVNLTQAQIKQAVADEMQWFREQMETVAAFTDMPQLIVDMFSKDEARILSAHELALTCADELKTIDGTKLKKYTDELHQAADEAPHYKQVFHASGYWPTQWSVLPCYHKASRVYLKLFVSYARLCALDAVLNDR